MKVVMTTASVDPSFGGPVTAVLNIARCLAETEHEVVVVSQHVRRYPNHPDLTSAVQAGVRVRVRRVRRIAGFEVSVWQMLALFKEARGADIVSCHGFYRWSALAAYWAARLRGAALYIQPHGVFEPYQESESRKIKSVFLRFGGRHILETAQYVLFATELESLRAQSVRPEVAGKASVCGVGVAASASTRRVTTEKESTGRTHILYLSRIAPKKRLDVLLEAVERLQAEGVDIEVEICGAGDATFVNELKRKYSHVRATWHGHVAGARRSEIENRCDLFVLPSENENFGQAVTEAMAAGIAVLTTANVGAASHVLAADAGRVVDDCKIATLSDELRVMLSDIDRLRRYGRNGHEYALRELQWASVASRWIGNS